MLHEYLRQAITPLVCGTWNGTPWLTRYLWKAHRCFLKCPSIDISQTAAKERIRNPLVLKSGQSQV